MMFSPPSREAIGQLLAGANSSGLAIGSVDLSSVARLREHAAEDLTVTVEAGMTLAALQAHLSAKGQWLPLDPPGAGTLSLGALIATNATGPRRHGLGTVRDYLIGITVVLADGREIKSGGRVVKNVAGYDLAKLFIGSRGTLGLIVEASFKLLPLPPAEVFLQREVHLKDCGQFTAVILNSPLRPTVFDLTNLSDDGTPGALRIILGFAGTAAEVAWQKEQAAKHGFLEPATLGYEQAFWSQTKSPRQRWSMLPARVGEVLPQLGEAAFVCRLGNGLIHHTGEPRHKPATRPQKLEQRLKETFDPKGIFPRLA